MSQYVVICTGDLCAHPSEECPCLGRYPASGGVCRRVAVAWARSHGYGPCAEFRSRW
jgi:hypothetical protein